MHKEGHAQDRFVSGRVGIVGLGLMGASFAKALHASGTEVRMESNALNARACAHRDA
jgi:prephenate dehydrogenase